MKRRGFTMIEMMVTLAIVGIMASLSVVGGRALIAVSRVNSAASAMSAALRDVRTRARAGRCSQVMFVNPTATYANAAIPGGARALIEVNKRDCHPYIGNLDPAASPSYYTDVLDAWNFKVNTTDAKWSDRVVTMHNMNEFFIDPQIAGMSITATQGVAIAFDPDGNLAGTFQYTMPNVTAVANSWLTRKTTGISLVFGSPGTTFTRTITVSGAGEVVLQ